MRLAAITELTDEQHKCYTAVFNDLYAKLAHWPCNFDLDVKAKVPGYAHCTYTGYVPQRTIDALGRVPTELEVSMMCDGGFSHFGGSCDVNKLDNGTYAFYCKIYTD